jgi:hypothetical protein
VFVALADELRPLFDAVESEKRDTAIAPRTSAHTAATSAAAGSTGVELIGASYIRQTVFVPEKRPYRPGGGQYVYRGGYRTPSCDGRVTAPARSFRALAPSAPTLGISRVGLRLRPPMRRAACDCGGSGITV